MRPDTTVLIFLAVPVPKTCWRPIIATLVAHPSLLSRARRLARVIGESELPLLPSQIHQHPLQARRDVAGNRMPMAKHGNRLSALGRIKSKASLPSLKPTTSTLRAPSARRRAPNHSKGCWNGITARRRSTRCLCYGKDVRRSCLTTTRVICKLPPTPVPREASATARLNHCLDYL